MALDIIEDAAANKVPVETQFQRFVDAGAQAGRPKKVKTTTTPENIVDLVSTPPPPSPMKITKEQAPTPQSVSPLDLYKSAMSKAVKEKFDRDRDLQAFFEKLPALFTSTQKISTKAPIFTSRGHQPGQGTQSPIVATISLIFERNLDKESKVIARRSSIIALTVRVTQADLPATAPTEAKMSSDINSHP